MCCHYEITISKRRCGATSLEIVGHCSVCCFCTAQTRDVGHTYIIQILNEKKFGSWYSLCNRALDFVYCFTKLLLFPLMPFYCKAVHSVSGRIAHIQKIRKSVYLTITMLSNYEITDCYRCIILSITYFSLLVTT